jgi:hypothetical protein
MRLLGLLQAGLALKHVRERVQLQTAGGVLGVGRRQEVCEAVRAERRLQQKERAQ